MNNKEFNNFFKPYSKTVDSANKNGFWKLSDDLIMQIIKDNLLNITKKTVILDAGGGTGRWICDLAKILPSKFILYDLSKDMLEKARKNIKRNGIKNRVQVIHGDLVNMDTVKNNSVDYIISIYSPASFIKNKEKFFSELYRVLKKNGVAIIMGQGFYNALFSKITNYTANIAELNEIDNKKIIKWANYVPKLNLFSKEILENDLKKSGFNIKKTYGIPVFVQPGFEDFDPKNKQKSAISKALENNNFKEKVFEIEMKYNSLPTVINRGVNIFTVGIKK